MTTNTIRLHRVLRATPERVYKAFLDADAMCKWLPPNGFTGKIHHMDAKVGGTFKMSFTNFTTGKSMSFGGEYLELVPNERIRYTDRFDDPNLPGEIVATVTLKKVFCGTELNVVQEGVPDVIPAEACYQGWQESLEQLAKLVACVSVRDFAGTAYIERDLALITVNCDAAKRREVVEIVELFRGKVVDVAAGSITVSLQLANNSAEIHVTDTGIGIAEEHLKHLFSEFFQANNQERDRTKGFGLGLAIARRLALQLGGDLTVESAVGRGTRFSILLPGATTLPVEVQERVRAGEAVAAT